MARLATLLHITEGLFNELGCKLEGFSSGTKRPRSSVRFAENIGVLLMDIKECRSYPENETTGSTGIEETVRS